MPKVRFMPVDMVVEAAVGESILDVALNHDIPLQHACGGFCSCTTCHVHVKEGLGNLSPIDEEEEERIASADELKPESRLGCQARVQGDVTVFIVNME